MNYILLNIKCWFLFIYFYCGIVEALLQNWFRKEFFFFFSIVYFQIRKAVPCDRFAFHVSTCCSFTPLEWTVDICPVVFWCTGQGEWKVFDPGPKLHQKFLFVSLQCTCFFFSVFNPEINGLCMFMFFSPKLSNSWADLSSQALFRTGEHAPSRGKFLQVGWGRAKYFGWGPGGLVAPKEKNKKHLWATKLDDSNMDQIWSNWILKSAFCSGLVLEPRSVRCGQLTLS